MEEETKKPEFMTSESFVAAGEENDVRVAKRNVVTIERFLQAGKPQFESLTKRGLMDFYHAIAGTSETATPSKYCPTLLTRQPPF